MVLEQFTALLPEGTGEWVQCHCLISLEEVIRLAEDHVMAFPGAGEPPALSLSHAFPPPVIPILSVLLVPA